MKYGKTAFLLSLALPLATAHADYGQGLSAYQRGDYRAAHAEFEPIANSGHNRAQYMLGRMYESGDGVLQDFAVAHKWYNLSAANGHLQAKDARDRVASRMSPTALARAQQQARDFNAQPATSAPAATSATAGSSYSDASIVRDIQKMLSELGYDPGPADGQMGSRTRDAIHTYQGHSGLSQDGRPSLDLRNALAGDLGYPIQSAGNAQPAPAPVTQTPAVVAQTAPASGSRYSSTYREDSRPLDPRHSELVTRLNKLIDEAETARAADPRFLKDLRAALTTPAGSSVTPVAAPAPAPVPVPVAPAPAPVQAAAPRVLIDERFTDGNFSSNPTWRIASGNFEMDRYGMRSRVAAPAPEKDRKTKKEDIPIALLGALLGAQTGGSSRPVVDDQPAEAYVMGELPTALSLQARVLELDGPGRFEIGLYRDGTLDSGLRIAVVSGAQPEVLLYEYERGQAKQRAVYRGNLLRTGNGTTYQLELRRTPGGNSEVLLDGRRVISANDGAGTRGFSGIVYRNLLGDFALAAVRGEEF